MSRAWRIPSGEDQFFPAAIPIEEFMVSPGRPAINGHCSSWDEGAETSEYEHYRFAYSLDIPSQCDAIYAFSRIVKPIQVAQDDYIIVNYDLTITFNTGLQYTDLTITTQGGTTREAGYEWNWSGNFKARGNLVHHGLKVVRGTDSNDWSTCRNQDLLPGAEGLGYSPEIGEACIGRWGAPLEPTCQTSQLQAYFSSDNIQFLVNPQSGGKMQTGQYWPYKVNGIKVIPSGTMTWHTNPNTTDYIIGGGCPGQDTIYGHTRLTAFNTCPDTTDASQDSMLNTLGRSVTAVASTSSSRPAIGIYPVASSRYRTGDLYAFEFDFNGGYEDLVSATPNRDDAMRALVLAYGPNSNMYDLVPFYDAVIADGNPATTDGTESYLPFDTGHFVGDVPHYDLPTEGNLSGYNYFSTFNEIIRVSFLMTWESECPDTVEGCPGYSP
jgi:hypothetical protein